MPFQLQPLPVNMAEGLLVSSLTEKLATGCIFLHETGEEQKSCSPGAQQQPG